MEKPSFHGSRQAVAEAANLLLALVYTSFLLERLP